MNVLIAILVTITMAGVDYCHARYALAMAHRDEHNKPDPQAVGAALWSIGQWSCASVGFVVAVKLSMWYLLFEAVGLFAGTMLGARRVKRL